jgi:lactoylglutathione lyase
MTDVQELRLVLTVPDIDAALRLYRDALRLPVEAVWDDETGRVVLLSAGRATLELNDEGHAAEIDRIEVGRRVAGPVRIAWNDRNARLETPDGTQLTLFTTLE